jgi:intracellular multiplication protein IcmL
MSLSQLQESFIRRDHNFYRKYYHYFFMGLMLLIVILALGVSRVFFQILHRPLPDFTAMQRGNLNERMMLYPFEEPNLLAPTLLRFASKAASSAYTFDFVNYEKEIAEARPYFTEAGWADFRAAISGVAASIVQKQLFVTGIVSDPPIISNQGPFPGKGYVWRVQIPFLVTYQSANEATVASFVVMLSIVQVPTSINPQGIGIDQFVMVSIS